MLKRFVWVLMLLLATVGARAQQCDTIAYHDGFSPATYAPMPLVDEESNITRLAYYINPAANGNLTFLRMMFYNYAAGDTHAGTMRIWVQADNSGEPGNVLAGPLDVSTNSWTARYNYWDQVSLAGLNYNFTGGVPFHVVWEFIPATANDVLDILLVNAAGSMGSQLYDEISDSWGLWFNAGDLMQQVGVCYTTTLPGDVVFSQSVVDQGRVELGHTITDVVDVSNEGQMNATLTSVSVTNPAHFSASVSGGLPQVMAPDASTDLSVLFTPGQDVLFRDTTTVVLNWTTNSLNYTTELFVLAGSSEGQLTNEWVGSPDELDWHIAATGDTSYAGAYWQLFSGGFNRNGAFAGHRYTEEGDTASSELYAFLDNSNLDNLDLSFAYTQNYSGDTQDHAILVYGVENDSLVYLYGYDITEYQSTAPTWAHLSATLEDLPDSVAVSFYYGGTYADDWFVDDVDFTRSCSPIAIDVSYSAGNVVVSWLPFPGETVRILRSADAYDFTSAVEVAAVSSEDGTATLAPTGTSGFFKAVRDCTPVLNAPANLRKLARHPDGVTARRMDSLMPLSALAAQRGATSIEQAEPRLVRALPAATR